MLRLNRVQVQLVHDDVKGPAVPEVHNQSPVKDGLWEVVCKAGQTELPLPPLLSAGAGKVQGGVKLFKLWQGAAGEGGGGGEVAEREGEERQEEEIHLEKS